MVKGLFTISLDPGIAKQGKELAAASGKPFSGFIQDLLLEKIRLNNGEGK